MDKTLDSVQRLSFWLWTWRGNRNSDDIQRMLVDNHCENREILLLLSECACIACLDEHYTYSTKIPAFTTSKNVQLCDLVIVGNFHEWLSEDVGSIPKNVKCSSFASVLLEQQQLFSNSGGDEKIVALWHQSHMEEHFHHISPGHEKWGGEIK